MKRVAVFIVVIALSHQLNGQVTVGDKGADSFDKPVYGLGFAGGPLSGLGFSFRSHFPSKTSVQIVFGVIKTKEKISTSVGGEFQYDVVRNPIARFFVGCGAGYFYAGESGIDRNNMEAPTRYGFGLGGEYQAYSALHVTGEIMITFFSDGSIIPLPQISAHYYFN